jgi:hypothetical protein
MRTDENLKIACIIRLFMKMPLVQICSIGISRVQRIIIRNQQVAGSTPAAGSMKQKPICREAQKDLQIQRKMPQSEEVTRAQQGDPVLCPVPGPSSLSFLISLNSVPCSSCEIA